MGRRRCRTPGVRGLYVRRMTDCEPVLSIELVRLSLLSGAALELRDEYVRRAGWLTARSWKLLRTAAKESRGCNMLNVVDWATIAGAKV